MSALGVGSNLCQLTGVWMLSRSWKMASIVLPGGRSGFLAVGAVTAALAVLVAGPGAVESGRALAGGDLRSLVLFVSAVVDIIALCLVAPLLLTAVSLRGGLFVWPWRWSRRAGSPGSSTMPRSRWSRCGPGSPSRTCSVVWG